MSLAEGVLLLVAGIAGGLSGSIAGLASLATYPALLAVGPAAGDGQRDEHRGPRVQQHRLGQRARGRS